jgi:tRNA(Ile)-lysidine synthetase-like protein
MPDPVSNGLIEACRTGLLPEGAAVVLAVSGGADSLALLYGAHEVCPETRWRLVVGHVHHGWRGREADRDQAFVAEHARRLGIPFAARAVDARAHARRTGLSPEAAARDVRYEALREIARASGASRIATAHQRDDRLESYLLALSRRGGIASLGGPRRLRADGVARPLLSVSRREIEEFLTARGLSWRRDATNGDLALDRNRVRRELAALEAWGGTAALDVLERRAAQAAVRRERVEAEFEMRLRPRLEISQAGSVADALALSEAGRDAQRLAVEEMARPFARPGHPPLTGAEREKLLDRLASGADFRFEAGRRIRFSRRGSLFSAAPAPRRTV